MADGYLSGGGGYNILTLPPPVSGLVLTTAPATINGSFNAVPATYSALALDYWVVRQLGRIPDTPFDGVAVKLTNTTGAALLSFALTGLINDTEYGVRIFVRGAYGYQTDPTAAGFATPKAGLLVRDMPVETLIKAPLGGVGWNWIAVQKGKPSNIYDDSFLSSTMFLSKDIYEKRQWHSSDVNEWANSTLNAHLNGAFLNLFDAGFAAKIKQVKIPYRPGSGTSMSVNSGANGLPCKAFSLSGCEMGWANSNILYFPPDGACLSYFAGATEKDAKRIAYLNGSATCWWLRSPRTKDSTGVWFVRTEGDLNIFGCSGSYGVRPAFVLPDDVLFSPVPNADGSYSPI